MHVCVYVEIRVYMFLHIVDVHMHIHIYIYIFICIYKHSTLPVLVQSSQKIQMTRARGALELDMQAFLNTYLSAAADCLC